MSQRYQTAPPPVELATAYHHTSTSVYPQSADLLRAYIWATLARINRTDPHEARILFTILRHLASIEAKDGAWDSRAQEMLVSVSRDEGFGLDDFVDACRRKDSQAIATICRAVSYNARLCEIIYGKSSSHDLHTLTAQRDLLGAYLRQHQFDSLRFTSARRRWVCDRLSTFLDLISLFPCQCIDTTAAVRREIAGDTIKDWLQRKNQYPTQRLTPRTLILTVLGAYHNMPAETLRKMLERVASTAKTLTKKLAK